MNDARLDTLYYWKFEEPEQLSKRWNGPYIKETYETREAYRARMYKHAMLTTDVWQHLCIVVDGKTIGEVMAYWVDKNTDWLELGIVIYDPAYWEAHIGTEVFQLWVDYLFESNVVHRLGISTWSGNVRMMKLAARVGMVEEARIREARVVDGVRYDAIKMGILRSEWCAHKKDT